MEHKDKTAFGRRDFLKTTAVVGAFGALSSTWADGLVPSAQAAKQVSNDRTGTQIIHTNCRSCTADCGVLAHVKDGRVIKLEGDPAFERSEGALCTKGLAGIQALYHPNRIKYPMKRVGARGENKWKRISWKEAIDEIAQKLMEIREKYGAESVMGSTGGGGNPNFPSVCRFCNVFGTPNWFEPGASQCYMPRQTVYQMMYGGGPNGNPSLGDSQCIEAYFYNDIKMKTFVLWGTDPSYSGPAQAGRVLVELRARGVKTVVIDPRFTPDAAKADVWLPIRPGTDVALMMAWIKRIIDLKLYDYEFVLKWTNLPFLVNTETKMILRESELIEGGRADTYVIWDTKTKAPKGLTYPWDDALSPALEGKFTIKGVEYKTGFTLLRERVEPFTIAAAAQECGLEEKKIIEAIKLYAESTPSGLALGVATDHGINSAEAAMGGATLDIIMGNVERPGSILQRYAGDQVGGLLRTTRLNNFLPHEQLLKRMGGIEHKGMLKWWVAQPGPLLEAMVTGKPYSIHAWIERSGNKLGVVANAARWVEGMKNVDLIVHAFLYPTSFSAYSDYLIPLTEWLESDFITNSFNKMYARQAVTHTWETANEVFFWAQLTKRCGELGHKDCQRAFDPKETAPEIPYFNTYEEKLDAWAGYFNMTWKEYIAKVPFENVPYNVWRRYYIYKEIDPKTGNSKGFSTPSKKCEVYGECFITLGRTGKPLSPFDMPPASKDYDPLLVYREPAENSKTLEGKQFPLIMTNGRLPVFHHTTLRNIPYIREIFPVAEIWVNPKAAKLYGVAQGDWVYVESARGKIHAKARVTEGIPPDTVYMERFWNPETLNTPTHGWKEMNVNVLSRHTAPYNEMFGTYTLRGFRVKISKAEGAPKGIWEKPEDFKPWLPQSSETTKVVTL